MPGLFMQDLVLPLLVSDMKNYGKI